MLAWETIEISDQLSPAPPRLGNWLRTERARTVGGWLVRTILIQREAVRLPDAPVDAELNSSVALAFVPDPNWSWKI